MSHAITPLAERSAPQSSWSAERLQQRQVVRNEGRLQVPGMLAGMLTSWRAALPLIHLAVRW